MASNKRSIREISIANLGVIESATLELGNGFNVLTGETGAGKTMILTALGLLAGEKADSDFIRAGAEKLSVACIVHSDEIDAETIAELISEHDPAVDDGEIVLARSVSRDGKNRAQVGGSLSTAGIVSKFANEFYSIHGQGSNQKLLSPTYQRRVVDLSDDQLALKTAKFRVRVSELRERLKQVAELRKSLGDREANKAKLLAFQKEWQRMSLKSGEWESINERIEQLDSVEEWQSALAGALAALDDEERGGLSSISKAIRSLNPISGSSEVLRLISERLSVSKNELSDLRNEMSNLLGNLESEPGELDKLRERKAALLGFLKKNSYLADAGPGEEEKIQAFIEYGLSIEGLLVDLEGGDERLAEIEAEIATSFQRSMESADEISKLRKGVSKQIENAVTKELEGLGLGGAAFSIDLSLIQVNSPDDLPLDGLDEIVFKFASHQSVSPLPLNKGISGGELSRLMLAIELALVSDRNPSAIIFDEVDAGIGGETANVVGERIAKLAKSRQIIVVTHLPQVAVWADNHFVITKSANQEFVHSSVGKVSGDEREKEVARMLSGEVENAAALLHARSLLEHARSE